ncbi:hypothetical protein DPMN_090055 [Dreissena polymorpha]|uniref:Uncharacterized protein n=1 Tax=Dreissena polymorpha TaxID=45954 RepID=A0A9D4QXZ9_DREPO|nr:hypothetical protein DPMN_090055 [Dreissena polymorpha]
MQETLHDHHISISIGRKPISNLRFVDDIDLMGEEHDQHHCRHHRGRREARRSGQLQVLGRNHVQRWHQYRCGPNKNCNGDPSDDQTQQIVDKQFHQLHHQSTGSTSPL